MKKLLATICSTLALGSVAISLVPIYLKLFDRFHGSWFDAAFPFGMILTVAITSVVLGFMLRGVSEV